MLKKLHKRVKDLERRLNVPNYSDLSNPEHRRRAYWHYQLMDHAFLRAWWTNFHPVTEGVYRSNQPGPARLRRYHEMGIRAVLNLRGAADTSYHLFERDACRRYGMEMVDIGLSARSLPLPDTLLELERIFRTIPRPFVMHCKSGADRAGFASALYLMMIEGAPVEVAARQLHWRYLHLKKYDTGVLDHFLRTYARAQRRSGIGLMEWIRTGYDRDAVGRDFQLWRKGEWEAE
ncbi:tyrosine-protein phosphatase [Acidimangrovimonas pyrenivorans]|uniref:Tyrosine-protein phosphatase n=1 Tax=Acidimangrovimonas pyrenivorans TaxID=2030798 RepID=A0ABV7AC28_9RHOB